MKKIKFTQYNTELRELWGYSYLHNFNLMECNNIYLPRDSIVREIFLNITNGLDKNKFEQLCENSVKYFTDHISRFVEYQSDKEYVKTFYKREIKIRTIEQIIEEVHSIIFHLILLNDVPLHLSEIEQKENLKLLSEHYLHGRTMPSDRKLYVRSIKDIIDDAIEYYNHQGMKIVINQVCHLAANSILIFNKDLKELKKRTPRLEGEAKSLNNELTNAHNLIKRIQDKIRSREKHKNIPLKSELTRLANQARFKNNKINFSALGRELGRNNKTTKEWCSLYGIK